MDYSALHCWDIVTHCIAVQKENTKGFATFIFQAHEKGVVTIQVVSTLGIKQR